MSSSYKNIVSVFVLTYNQEKYIGQTIDSILSQRTNFDFNIVIGEDCSTDKTLEILKKYKAEYPDKIEIITSDENVGLIRNFVRTIKQCDGKYIAICDGDDYWIDDNKLQMKVDFLEQNQDFSIVFTEKNNIYRDGTVVTPKLSKQDTSGFEELVEGNYIASVTVLFRNTFYKKDLPDWFLKYPYGDWPVYLMTVKDGSKIKFINKITANYRKDIGQSFKLRKKVSNVFQTDLNILKDLISEPDFGNRVNDINRGIIKQRIRLMMTLNRERNYFMAIKQYLILLFHINFFKLNKQYFSSFIKNLK